MKQTLFKSLACAAFVFLAGFSLFGQSLQQKALSYMPANAHIVGTIDLKELYSNRLLDAIAQFAGINVEEELKKNNLKREELNGVAAVFLNIKDSPNAKQGQVNMDLGIVALSKTGYAGKSFNTFAEKIPADFPGKVTKQTFAGYPALKFDISLDNAAKKTKTASKNGTNVSGSLDGLAIRVSDNQIQAFFSTDKTKPVLLKENPSSVYKSFKVNKTMLSLIMNLDTGNYTVSQDPQTKAMAQNVNRAFLRISNAKDSAVKIELVVFCKDSQSALQIQQIIMPLSLMLTQSANTPQQTPAQAEMANSFRCNVAGNNCVTTLTVPAEVVIAAIQSAKAIQDMQNQNNR